MKAAVILGAGFSKNSGIPVQDEIPKLLVSEAGSCEFDNAAGKTIERFMKDVFGYNGTDNMPGLDDIFTCIDISTNSGHRLGIDYSSLCLRAVRRMVIYRLFCILEKYFKPAKDVTRFLNMINNAFSNTGYVILNWDTVLEKYCLSMFDNITIDYCNGGMFLRAPAGKRSSLKVHIAKVHGSSNWLYCDNCRMVFNDLYNDISVMEKAGFKQNDFSMFKEFKHLRDTLKTVNNKWCPICMSEISSHIATFSYRKTFKANSFPDVWNSAEKILSDTDRWIFVGYSLPEADYEFKHLLKIAELKLRHMRESDLKVDVILLDDNSSINKFKKFFGNRINIICNKGIKEYMKHVSRVFRDDEIITPDF